MIKGYVCLFICLATKALHIEAITELSTDAFLNTLKRFISRRGKPNNIYSDNGTNFIGANTKLQKLYDCLFNCNREIETFLATDKIQWHYMPPKAPNFGGIWETNIKRVKTHLLKICGGARLNYEEFATILTQIEAVLNSTPLCPLSPDNNPDQLNPLTPAHFLIGRPLTALPQLDVTEVNETKLNKYQRLESIVQHFWKR